MLSRFGAGSPTATNFVLNRDDTLCVVNAVERRSVELIILSPLSYSHEVLVNQQESDPVCAALLCYLRTDVLPVETDLINLVKSHINKCKIVDDVLYFSPGNAEKLCFFVPLSLRDEILFAMHDDAISGHFKVRRTYLRLIERFYWPGCRKDVQMWVKKCPSCQRAKGPARYTVPPMHPLSAAAQFQRVVMDTMGPLSATTLGNRHVLILTDWFSRWVEIFPLVDITARTIAKVFVEDFVCKFGAPRELLSDQGAAFKSELFEAICTQMNVVKTFSTPYSPQTQGICERFNYTLVNMIKATHSNAKDGTCSYLTLNLLTTLPFMKRQVIVPIFCCSGEIQFCRVMLFMICRATLRSVREIL